MSCPRPFFRRVLAHWLCIGLFCLLPAFAADMAKAGQRVALDMQSEAFAVCAGRYIAFQEPVRFAGQRLAPEIGRAQFRDLLHAVMPVDDHATRVALLRSRRQSQSALSRLLSIAHSSVDPRRARLAQATIDRQMRICESMLLG